MIFHHEDTKTQRIILGIFFLFLFLIFYLPSPEFDFWWHLKVGELIWKSKQVFTQDFLSFGKTVRWVHHEWLSDVLFYFVYAAFSFHGLLALHAIVLCAACFLVFKMCKSETGNVFLSLCVTFLCALALIPWKPGAGLRPHFFTLYFTALTQYVLFYKKKTAWLPFVFFLWGNLHGGYLSGFILLFAFCISEWPSKDRRRFVSSVKLFSLCFFAGLLTPNHAHEFIYPFQILARRDLYQYNFEWTPPAFHQVYSLPFFAVCALFSFLCFARLLNKNVFKSGEIFFLLPYFLLSSLSLRNMPLFAVVSAPALARGAKTFLQSFSDAAQKKVLWCGMSALMIFLFVVYIKTVPPAQRGLSPSIMASQVPEKAAAFIHESHLPGPLFPEPDWGGYMLFKLYPPHRVGVDTRFDTVYDKNYLVRVIQAFAGAPGWEMVFQETKTNLILMDAIATPLKEELYASDDYKLIYYDGQSVLFMRSAPENEKVIQKFHAKDLEARQFGYYYYRHGMDAMRENKLERARELFHRGVSIAPQEARLHYFLGAALSKQKKYNASYLSLKNAVALSPGSVDYLYSLGYVCVLMGKKQEAKSTLEKLLEISPRHEDAKKLLKAIDK